MQQVLTIQMRKPHSEKQRLMVEYPGSIVAFCGRRFGKTDAYVQRLFYHMQRQPGLYWWVGLSWRSASMKRAFRLVTYYARRILHLLGIQDRGYINRSTSEAKIPGLGEIWFRTADNPASMAGEGIRGVVLDEFSLMQEIVWTEYVQATLLDYGGWAAFSGVPKGRNWAANLWQSSAGRDGWRQIHATSYDNPYMSVTRLDKIRAESSEALFRQEYLAEILEGEGMVFRRVMEAATATALDEMIGGRQYVMGIDWGRSNDFTVIAVVDMTTAALVYLDRFNQIDYTVQRGRVIAAYERFRPAQVIVEVNAMGQPVADELLRDGLPISGFTTTNASKARIIDNLALAFERGTIRILNDAILIGELQAYEMERTSGGLMRYGAPPGMHDDTVMALAMAWHGATDMPDMVQVTKYDQRNNVPLKRRKRPR